MKRIEITGYHTFGIKNFKKICEDERLTLYNVFGFGLWIIKNKEIYKQIKAQRRR